MINEISQEQLNIVLCRMDNLIHYKGWTIYQWTGWKYESKSLFAANDSTVWRVHWGSWFTPDDYNEFAKLYPCSACKASVKHGDFVVMKNEEKSADHYSCLYGDRPDKLTAEWVATKLIGNDKWNHLTIDVDSTEDADDVSKDAKKEDGLVRLYELIDSTENANEIR